MSVEKNMYLILSALAGKPRSEGDYPYVSNNELQELSGLGPDELNDAVEMLVSYGYLEWLRTMGTAPYNFRDVALTPAGRYEYERMSSETQTDTQKEVKSPPLPIGSPYGFTDQDWETVAELKSETSKISVVFGYAFKSENYDTDKLKENVESTFIRAVGVYNQKGGALRIGLNFNTLSAGYGEHLFNEIVRNIISADIAVFDTSDLNPNVMLEMGVALTWGLRVLPIKSEKCPKPPSDISGQTWADYRDSGEVWVDNKCEEKIVRMIDRAMRKKAAS